VRRGGAELVGEQLVERVGDSGAVGPVQGDGDAGGPVVNPATEVEQVAQDGPVLVGVGEVGVEMLGQRFLCLTRRRISVEFGGPAGIWPVFARTKFRVIMSQPPVRKAVIPVAMPAASWSRYAGDSSRAASMLLSMLPISMNTLGTVDRFRPPRSERTEKPPLPR
jgi:hypothetical protein